MSVHPAASHREKGERGDARERSRPQMAYSATKCFSLLLIAGSAQAKRPSPLTLGLTPRMVGFALWRLDALRLSGSLACEQQPPRFRTIQVYPKDLRVLRRQAKMR
jgi:hypothetical protein